MHIAIEAVGTRSRGGATVLQDLLAQAISDSRIRKITLFCSPRSARQFTLPVHPKLLEIEQPAADSNVVCRLLWLAAGLRRAVCQVRPDVLFCFNGVGLAPKHAAQVAFIQQSLPFCPEAFHGIPFVSRIRLWAISANMRLCCRASKKIIVQTQTMAACVRLAFSLGADSMFVALPVVGLRPKADNAGSKIRHALEEHSAEHRLLFVGGLGAHKNFGLLANAMPGLRAAVPTATLIATVDARRRDCREPGIVAVGYLDPPSVEYAYTQVAALVMPSLVETVGLPMLEAMNAGVPVLAADRPYAREICEDAAIYFDPLDVRDYVRQATRILTDEPLRKVLISNGRALLQTRSRTNPYEEMIGVMLQCVHMSRKSFMHNTGINTDHA